MAAGIEKSRGQLRAAAAHRGDVIPVASNRIPVHSSRYEWQIITPAAFVTRIVENRETRIVGERSTLFEQRSCRLPLARCADNANRARGAPSKSFTRTHTELVPRDRRLSTKEGPMAIILIVLKTPRRRTTRCRSAPRQPCFVSDRDDPASV